MLSDIDVDRLLLNISLVILWYPINFQSVYAIIFSVTFNLIAVILKVVSMDV